MKNIVMGVLIMTIATASAAPVQTQTPDVAQIKTIVESVAILADSGNFESLEKLFAEEIHLDYSSLSGDQPQLKSPRTLMTEWASVLPGFDRTRHALSNIVVTQDGNSATATADVVADHYFKQQHWQVRGDYHYRLVKLGQRWEITTLTFNLRDEKGSRDIFGPVLEQAKANPPAYIVREQTATAVRAFLTSLETKDMDTFAGLWADDAVQHMPYSPKGHPKQVVGKDNIVKLYAGWPQNSGKADFTSHLVFHPMQDPETVFVEFKGDVAVIPTGRQYKQTYGGFFHVAKGKIQLFREYFDPAPFAWAFGLSD